MSRTLTLLPRTALSNSSLLLLRLSPMNPEINKQMIKDTFKNTEVFEQIIYLIAEEQLPVL